MTWRPNHFMPSATGLSLTCVQLTAQAKILETERVCSSSALNNARCLCCVSCCVQLAREGIKKASDQIHSSYAAQGVAGKLLLTRPTVDNPRNVLDAVLYGAMFEVGEGSFPQGLAFGCQWG